jgi:DNA-binding MarR family transcriptional regulator
MKQKITDSINIKKLSLVEKEKFNKYLMKSFEQNASESMNFRLTPFEYQILKAAASKKNMTITDLIRLFIIRDLYLNDE